MGKALVASCAAVVFTFSSVGAFAMSPIAVPGTTVAPAVVRIADGCGAGRYRGVSGFCAGHRVPTIKKVCTARRYAGALVRRCHTYRM